MRSIFDREAVGNGGGVIKIIKSCQVKVISYMLARATTGYCENNVNVNEKVSHLGKRKVSHPKFKKRVVQVFFLPVSVFRSLNR